MKKANAVLFILFAFIAFAGCRHKDSPPPASSISKFSQTQFTPTLENIIDSNKNVVYTPAFLYAWAQLKQTLNCSIVTTGGSSSDLLLLDSARNFESALDKGEYETKASIEDDQINAEASFKLALPFASKMDKIDNGITFDYIRVKAFGSDLPDEKIAAFTDIVYYQDDDHFAIRITPKDSANTIILVKGITLGNSLKTALMRAFKMMIIGERESAGNQNAWKFNFNPGDDLAIPVIKFNIEASYNSLVGQTAACNGKTYPIETAKQTTAFVLDENGAKVESKAVIATSDSTSVSQPAHVKHLTLNKPFLIMIGKKRRESPYFVMWVDNAELMEKI